MTLRRLLFPARHPRAVLALVAMVAVAGGAWGWNAPSHLSNRPADFYSDSSESLRTLQELESGRETNSAGSPNLAVIVRSDSSRVVLGVKRRLEGMRQVAGVNSNVLTSRDGHSTLLLAWSSKGVAEEDAAARVARAFAGSPDVLVGGRALAKRQFSEVVKHDLWRGELIALPLLMILGLWFFRSVIAALLPVAIGSFALLLALGCLRLAAGVMPLSIFCLSIASGLALGLAVDYSLLMVSRFRDELSLGLGRDDAVLAATATAGKTVAISSAAIAGSFSCLLFIPVPFVRSIAVAGMLVASIAGMGALLILPAAFTLLGERVDALPLRVGRPRSRGGGWYRLARFVIRKPVPIAVVSGLALVALSLPALGMRFTAFDETSLPTSSPLRVFSAQLREEFQHPLLNEIRIAVRGSEKKASAIGEEIERIAKRSKLAVPFPFGFKLGPRLYEIRLNPTGSSYSEGTMGLVDRLRRLRAPVAVGGSTAAYMDLTASLKQHLLAVLLVLALVSFVFLSLATRSLVLPVKALIMNVLSLGSALGVLVVLFQDGRLEGLLGYTSQNSLVVVLPVVLGVGAFGLVTDYGLFLLMRIREARAKGCSDREAIMLGLEKTGPIVTAAALLFSVAVGVLVTSEIILVKEVAIGIVTAVVLDAFVVRPFLVPSLMAILGRWNWWPSGAPGETREASKPLRATS